MRRCLVPWSLFALALLLNVFFLLGYWFERQFREEMLQGPTRGIVRILALDPEQQDRFQAFRAQMRGLARRIRKVLRPFRRQIWEELEKPVPDRERILGLLKEVDAQRERFRRQALEALLDFLGHLTPRQRRRFLQITHRHTALSLGLVPILQRRPAMGSGPLQRLPQLPGPQFSPTPFGNE